MANDGVISVNASKTRLINDQEMVPHHLAKFHQNRSNSAEIWRFNGFQNGGRPPSWIFEIFKFLTVLMVKRPILHHYAKCRKDWSIRWWDIAIFVIFKMAAAAILDFKNSNFFYGLIPVGGQCVSLCWISSTFMELLRRYGNVTVFQNGNILHLGCVGCVFGPPTMSTWWSLMLCKIWLELMQ